MSTDIAALTDSNWDEDVVSKGIIEYQSLQPIHTVTYGVIFNRIFASKNVKSIKSTYGQNMYEVYVIATTKDEIWDRVNHLITIYDTFNASGNARYNKILMNLENLEWKGDTNWRFVKFEVTATKVKDSTHRIYDPSTNMNLDVR